MVGTWLRELRKRIAEKRGLPIGTRRMYQRGNRIYQREKVANNRWRHVPVVRRQQRFSLKNYTFYGMKKPDNTLRPKEIALRKAAQAYEELTGKKVQPVVALKRFLMLGGIRNFPNKTKINLDLTDQGIRITLSHPRIGMARYLVTMFDREFVFEKPKPYLYLSSVYVREGQQGQGFGLRFFSDMVESARRMGIARIELYAASGNMNGYYSWARMGADTKSDVEAVIKSAAVQSGVRSPGKIMKAFAKYGSLALGIARSKRLREWWKKNGHGTEMVFDVDPKSLSSQILKNYLRKRKINPDKRGFKRMWGSD